MVLSKGNRMYYGMEPVRLINPSILEDKSTEEVRDYFREVYDSYNGSYISFICRGCGNWNCSPETRTSEAEIVSVCSECFKTQEEKVEVKNEPS